MLPIRTSQIYISSSGVFIFRIPVEVAIRARPNAGTRHHEVPRDALLVFDSYSFASQRASVLYARYLQFAGSSSMTINSFRSSDGIHGNSPSSRRGCVEVNNPPNATPPEGMLQFWNTLKGVKLSNRADSTLSRIMTMSAVCSYTASPYHYQTVLSNRY